MFLDKSRQVGINSTGELNAFFPFPRFHTICLALYLQNGNSLAKGGFVSFDDFFREIATCKNNFTVFQRSNKVGMNS